MSKSSRAGNSRCPEPAWGSPGSDTNTTISTQVMEISAEDAARQKPNSCWWQSEGVFILIVSNSSPPLWLSCQHCVYAAFGDFERKKNPNNSTSGVNLLSKSCCECIQAGFVLEVSLVVPLPVCDWSWRAGQLLVMNNPRLSCSLGKCLASSPYCAHGVHYDSPWRSCLRRYNLVRASWETPKDQILCLHGCWCAGRYREPHAV